VSRGRLAVVVVAFAALVGGACGAAGDDDLDALPGSTAPTTAVPAAAVVTTAPPVTAVDPAADVSALAAGGDGTGVGDGGDPGDAGVPPDGIPGLPVALSMSPTGCLRPGTPVSVVVTTRPWASIAAVVEYADEDAHGTYAIGSADPTGTWRWEFVVPLDAPVGPATLGVSAQDRTPADDGNGASTTGEEGEAFASFEVGSSC
jgi:hypothetical protein